MPDYFFPPHVYNRAVDGQMVLLNLETEQYFGLDAVGTNIVTRLTEQSPESAIEDLLGDYQVDPQVLRRDIEELLEKLMAAGLLVRSEGTA
ncbi:MAG TPA: PqqD family protein [Acidimicrobiia bacterium]|jgi:hypothetical protein|nr:PqqD family protein [Acidimicrobiia bacterium]